MNNFKTVQLMTSNRGQTSLIMVLISIVVTPVVVLGVMGLMNNLALSVQTSSRNDSIENAMAQVSSAFGSDPRYCAAILAGRVGFNPDDVDGEAVNQIAFYNLLNERQGDILNAGQVYDSSGVAIEDIRLVPVTRLTADTALAELVFNFSRGEDSPGGNRITRRLPLYVGYDSTGVVFCSTSAFDLYTIPQRICQHNGFGYSTYSPMQNHILPPAEVGMAGCNDLPAVEWVSGSNFQEANCGPGRRLAVPPLLQSRTDLPGSSLCRVSKRGAIELPPREYVTSTGVVAVIANPAQVGSSRAHPNTNSCSFEHHPSVVGGPNPVETFVKCVYQ